MRQIRFRGINKKTKKWVFGVFFDMVNSTTNEVHHFIIPEGTSIPKDKTIGEIQVEVVKDSVGQFTGVSDANDNPVFEGDIVGNDKVKRLVVYNNEYGCFSLCDYVGTSRIYGTAPIGRMIKDFFVDFVVLGNIHNNPELLK